MQDLVVDAVIEGVWCVRRRSYATCSYLVKRPEGVVLIDAGMDSRARDIARGLDVAGSKWTDVVAIILTHWHNDHTAGAKEAQSRSGAPVYCTAEAEPFLLRRTRRSGWRGRLGDRWPEKGPLVLFKGILTNAPRQSVANPRVVGDGDHVEGLQMVTTPGHTPGHLSVWDPIGRVLYAGDALAVVGGRVRHMSRSVTPDRPAAKAAMAKVLDLNPRVLCPGHRLPIVDPDLTAIRAATARKHWPLFG